MLSLAPGSFVRANALGRSGADACELHAIRLEGRSQGYHRFRQTWASDVEYEPLGDVRGIGSIRPIGLRSRHRLLRLTEEPPKGRSGARGARDRG